MHALVQATSGHSARITAARMQNVWHNCIFVFVLLPLVWSEKRLLCRTLKLEQYTYERVSRKKKPLINNEYSVPPSVRFPGEAERLPSIHKMFFVL